MALLSVQNVSAGDTYTTQAAAAGGDQIPQGTRAAGWDLGVALVVENEHTAAQDVTVEGQPLVSVPASGRALIPVHGIYFGETRTITYSGVTALSVAAVRMAGGVVSG